MAAPMDVPNLFDLANLMEDDDFIMAMLLDQMPEHEPTYDPTWTRFCLDDFTDEQCWNYFRFYPEDIREMVRLFNLPNKISVSNGCVATNVDAFCMVLRRLAYPNRLVELEPFFGRPLTTLSMIINETIDELYIQHNQRITSPDNPLLDRPHLQQYADAIHAKNAPLENIFGFIDGTVRPMCRPTRYQNVCYNGHKRVHSLKFQSIVVPSGLCAHLFGPMEGRRHDCALLAESGLLNDLQNIPLDRHGRQFGIYGDPAYPMRDFLYCPFRGANLRPEEVEFNRRMSSVRESVEWVFGDIIRNWAFLDFKKDLKVLMSPIAKYYVIGGLLTNCRTCLYGNTTSDYFNLAPPSIQEYLS